MVQNMYIRELGRELLNSAKHYPVVTIIGPRQSGKSTLVRACFPDMPYKNLEDPEIMRYVNEDPKSFLKQNSNGVILDEIQNAPELLSYIQVIVDENKASGQFILTGSHQLALHAAIAQSLAGRTAMLTLLPLSINELQNNGFDLTVDKQILQGGYPRIYAQNLDCTRAYADYYRTYVQRDVRQMINIKDISLFEKFIKLCAGRIGAIFEASSLANEVGVSGHTINSWLSILEASHVIFRLQPYFENFGKRSIKSPKLYFTDVGLASYLLDIENISQVARDPLRGALFENLVILELMKYRFNQGAAANIYYYRDNHKNEVDVIIKYGNELIPIEIKSAETFHRDFLKHVSYLQKIAGNRVKKAYVIYAGINGQKVQDVSVINYKDTSKIWAELASD
jgi:predicted AAA+ superfamily ATPase